MADQREIVDVYLIGGQVVAIDATATLENGMLADCRDGGDEIETTSEMIEAVRRTIMAGNALLKVDGWPFVFAHGERGPIGYGYRSENR